MPLLPLVDVLLWSLLGFVVVLVLLLKAFVAEAFVIPTGSMATTLLGYQKSAECPMCHFHFPVNCSDQEEHQRAILGTTCPNCRFDIDFPSEKNPSCDSGDRVLVAKYLYDSGVVDPQQRVTGIEEDGAMA